MTEATRQILFFISIGFYAVELFLFLFIKKTLQSKDEFSDLMINQIAVFFDQIHPSHIAAYSLIYAVFLFIGRFIPWMMSIVLTIQLISISFDFYILHKLKLD